jgi:putative redox protein
MALEVVATWRGGLATDVQARDHTIRIDEPASAGGTDTGMMPTELLCAALASCFCLAVGFAAGKRDQEVPGLKVTVSGERVDGELRYEHLVVTTEATLEPEVLARLVERARPLCWISNSLASGVSVEYLHTTTVNARFRK